MQKGTLLIIGLLVGVAVVAVVLVNGYQKPATTTGTQPTSQPEASAPAAASPSGEQAVREIMVEGKEFSFTPAILTVKQGETVRVVFKNTGTMPHDFVVDGLDVRTKVVGGGQQDTITFTASEKGTFEYYCSVGNHRARGMVGKITVE